MKPTPSSAATAPEALRRSTGANFPPRLLVPDEDRGEGLCPLRYEDVAQDGRVQLEALTQGVGHAVWLGIVEKRNMARPMVAAGVLPVLSRLVIEASDEPVPVAALHADGALELSHSRDEAGHVDRLFFNAWVDLVGRRGRTNAKPPSGAGERVSVGRVFAEHVFTRPWSPPGERRVTSLHFPGYPNVPEARWHPVPLESCAAIPDGGAALDEGPHDDTSVITFGLSHTDSNQHVNSLAYLRFFEEAAMRAVRSRGDGRPRLMRWIEIAYRKPFFAGDCARVRLQLFERNGELGAAGAFIMDGPTAAARPHAFVRAGFRPSP